MAGKKEFSAEVVMELEEHQYGAGLMSERSYPWAP